MTKLQMVDICSLVAPEMQMLVYLLRFILLNLIFIHDVLFFFFFVEWPYNTADWLLVMLT